MFIIVTLTYSLWQGIRINYQRLYIPSLNETFFLQLQEIVVIFDELGGFSANFTICHPFSHTPNHFKDPGHIFKQLTIFL